MAAWERSWVMSAANATGSIASGRGSASARHGASPITSQSVGMDPGYQLR
jgi:hypothetical protein